MKKILILTLCCYFTTIGFSQSKVMTPEQLIELNRVSAVGLTNDGKQVIFKTSAFDLTTNERSRKTYSVDVDGKNLKTIKH